MVDFAVASDLVFDLASEDLDLDSEDLDLDLDSGVDLASSFDLALGASIGGMD